MKLIALSACTRCSSRPLVAVGPANAAPKTVNGTVGPGFTISLKLGGKKVTQAQADDLHVQGRGQVVHARLPHLRPRRQQGDNGRRLQGNEDGHDQAAEGHVPLQV